jgi:predicted metal-dependent HD superfamily phosphohydrolase
VPPEALPQNLEHDRWSRLWLRLGGGADAQKVFHLLTAAYSEPVRAYHTAEHIRACLAEFDACRELARYPDEVEAALWFHDVVYVPGAPDNEEQSARLAEAALRESGVAAEVSRRIGDLIRATQHPSLPSDWDARLLCDIDLVILGRAPEVFAEYERRIRREYHWVPEDRYRQSRARLLAAFLSRPTIYLTSRFADLYEDQARQNLQRSAADLSSCG